MNRRVKNTTEARPRLGDGRGDLVRDGSVSKATGLSSSRCLPARAARSASGACTSGGSAIATASRRRSGRRRRAYGSAPCSPASAAALAGSRPQTPTNSTSGCAASAGRVRQVRPGSRTEKSEPHPRSPPLAGITRPKVNTPATDQYAVPGERSAVDRDHRRGPAAGGLVSCSAARSTARPSRIDLLGHCRPQRAGGGARGGRGGRARSTAAARPRRPPSPAT